VIRLALARSPDRQDACPALRLVRSAAFGPLRSSPPARPLRRPPGRAPISKYIGQTGQQILFDSDLTHFAFLDR